MFFLNAVGKPTIAVITLMFIWSSAAFSVDPLCNTPAKTLKTLKTCTRLYCSQNKDPKTSASLKGMDHTLFNHQALSEKLAETVKQFEEACQKVRRCSGKCPELEETQKLYPRIGIIYDQIEAVEAEIKALNADQNKIKTSDNAACFSEIARHVEDAERRRQRRVAEIDKKLEERKCEPGY